MRLGKEEGVMEKLVGILYNSVALYIRIIEELQHFLVCSSSLAGKDQLGVEMPLSQAILLRFC